MQNSVLTKTNSFVDLHLLCWSDYSKTIVQFDLNRITTLEPLQKSGLTLPVETRNKNILDKLGASLRNDLS